MVTKKKKVSLWFIIFGAILSGYAGYLLNGAWEPGGDINTFLSSFNRVCAAPFANYYNERTVKAVVIALVVYATALLMYVTSQRNFMPGKEFGTARFESPQFANKILMDKDENFNRILSQNVKMSLDFRRLKLNGNILICGGSGAGKTFYEVKPNLMQMPHNCSFICTDPKGEILRSCGEMLENNGYNVKVINLLEMDKSDCYNPFSYLREETDIVKLITNLISNTTPKGATPSDPFWEKAEGLFLQSIFYYVWLEEPPARRNFETVLQLLGEAEVTEQNKPSKLDIRMKFLEETSPLGAAHPAVKQYNKCMRGAGDTVRSIIISANSRLAFLENKQVLRMLSKDDLKLAELGIGVNGDGETKTALFCVIPDSDKSYNFIIGMLYTQIFQELYYQADFNCGGRLPIHVTFMLDEFANVALPDDYCSLLSTMRSREISSIIIIQNFAQLKALFKDTWETIPGNCDTFIYLGGNEQSTHKYVSELLGKGTIDKKSSGETKGRQGSSSRNYDVLGRELFTPDEVRKLDNKKCLIFIRGFDPIMDNKYIPFAHPVFSQTADGKGKPYVHVPYSQGSVNEQPYRILSPKALAYYEDLKEKGENVYIDSLTYEEFSVLTEIDMRKRFLSLDEKEQREKLNKEQNNELQYASEEEDTKENGEEAKPSGSGGGGTSKRKIAGEDTIMNRMARWQYSKEQKEELHKMMALGMTKEEILAIFYPETDVAKMREIRRTYRAVKNRQG
ncbi:MAG: VirD4-like conjugal transfer protein, CD1115 family [Acetatifactor sp.]